MKSKIYINARGFSILEAILSIALLGAGAMYGMRMMYAKTQARTVSEAQSQEAAIAFQVSNIIVHKPQLCPPVLTSGARMAACGACFSSDGKMTPNKHGKREFTLAIQKHGGEPDKPNENLCADGARYQVLMWWDNPITPNEMVFKVFNVSSNAKLKRTRRYTVEITR